MTVKELIERLQTRPPDTPVLVEGYETGFDEVVGLSRHELVRYRHAQPWDGEYQPVERFKTPASDTIQAAVILGRRGPLR